MPHFVVDIPTKHPAQCVNCHCPHNQDGRKYIDLQIDVIRYGRLYLCEHCFNEIASKLGYIKGMERLKELEDENRRLLLAIDSAVAYNSMVEGTNSFESKLESIARKLDTLAGQIGRKSQGKSVYSAEGERNSAEGESRSSEQSEVSRPNDVSAAFSLDGPV